MEPKININNIPKDIILECGSYLRFTELINFEAVNCKFFCILFRSSPLLTLKLDFNKFYWDCRRFKKVRTLKITMPREERMRDHFLEQKLEDIDSMVKVEHLTIECGGKSGVIYYPKFANVKTLIIQANTVTQQSVRQLFKHFAKIETLMLRYNSGDIRLDKSFVDNYMGNIKHFVSHGNCKEMALDLVEYGGDKLLTLHISPRNPEGDINDVSIFGECRKLTELRLNISDACDSRDVAELVLSVACSLERLYLEIYLFKKHLDLSKIFHLIFNKSKKLEYIFINYDIHCVSGEFDIPTFLTQSLITKRKKLVLKLFLFDLHTETAMRDLLIIINKVLNPWIDEWKLILKFPWSGMERELKNLLFDNSGHFLKTMNDLSLYTIVSEDDNEISISNVVELNTSKWIWYYRGNLQH